MAELNKNKNPKQRDRLDAAAVVQRCSFKKVFLEISQNSRENTSARVSFLIKLQAYNFIKKETLAQVFSCEFCEISKNIFLYRTPLVAASADAVWKLYFTLEIDEEHNQQKFLHLF